MACKNGHGAGSACTHYKGMFNDKKTGSAVLALDEGNASKFTIALYHLKDVKYWESECDMTG